MSTRQQLINELLTADGSDDDTEVVIAIDVNGEMEERTISGVSYDDEENKLVISTDE